MPQLCVDQFSSEAKSVNNLWNNLWMVKPRDPAVISISQIKAGDSPNIIGNTCFYQEQYALLATRH